MIKQLKELAASFLAIYLFALFTATVVLFGMLLMPAVMLALLVIVVKGWLFPKKAPASPVPARASKPERSLPRRQLDPGVFTRLREALSFHQQGRMRLGT